jgi:hypothetical protein
LEKGRLSMAEERNYANPIRGSFVRRIFEADEEEKEILGRTECARGEIRGPSTERETVKMEAACVGTEVLLGKIKKIAVRKRTAKRIKFGRGKDFEATDVGLEPGGSQTSRKLGIGGAELLEIGLGSRSANEER